MILDPLYMMIVLVGLVLSGGASLLVKSRFQKGKQTGLWSGMTGAEVARRVLDAAGVEGVEIVPVQGFLSDHYNPINKTLALSPDVYHGNNASSAGVAAHEAGHAIQHAQGYSPMWVRSALVPMANIGSTIGPWVIIIGILLGAAEGMGLGVSLAKIGVALFGLATLFTLVTVPVEFDASSRAKKMLEQLSIVRSEEESAAVAGVLSAAGLTYVAAAINSLLMLLYWAYRAGLLGGRRSN